MQQLAQNQLDFLRPLFVKAMTVLGFPLNSRPTPKDIKKKYRVLAKEHHPDKGGDEETMKEIVAAYELLIGKTKLRIPAPQPVRDLRVWVCVGNYGYSGTASTGTCCW